MTNTTREERDEALRCTSLCATRRYCEDVEFYRKVLRDADRLAAIERGLRELIESMNEPAPCDCIDDDGFVDCQCGNQDDYAKVKGWRSEQALVRKLRAILDPEG